MPEGGWTKSDGDILFASEMNRVGAAGRFIAIGSTGLFPTGMPIQTGGSVVMNAGSLTNPAHIDIVWYLFGTDGSTFNQPRIRISGVSANAALDFRMGNEFRERMGEVSILAGSPFRGFMRGTMFPGSNQNFTGSIVATSIPLTNFNSSDATVFFLECGSVAASTTDMVMFYSIQGFRGTISGT